MTAALVTAGCDSAGDKAPPGTVGHVKGFAGMVAADEPRAVLVAQDVLSAGGTAADAAIAAYFTMAVTLPSAASLGGQGSCVVHDPKSKRTEALDFLTNGNVVPANPRGMYALHAKYGKLRWEGLLGPAESLARLGSPVSRAFANEMAADGARLLSDPEARRIFTANGRPVREGDMLSQLDLGATLSRIRSRGLGDFYGGAMAHELADKIQAMGGSASFEDMRGYNPEWRAAQTLEQGNDLLYVPPLPVAGNDMIQLWKAAASGPVPVQGTAPANSTGLTMVDASGQAVACTFTANQAFGSGRVIPGTGIILAAPPAPLSPGQLPVIVANPHNYGFRLAAAGNGTAAAAAAIAAAGRRGVRDAATLLEAVRQVSLGQSRINIIACGSGAVSIGNCRFATDPKGAGMATAVGKD